MRIGLIAPLEAPVPPIAYGGIERIVGILAEGLAARGHDVITFASGDSRPAGKHVATWPETIAAKSIREKDLINTIHTMEILSHEADVDLWSNHLATFPLALVSRLKAPMLTTLHSEWIPEREELYRRASEWSAFTAISKYQRDRYADVSFAATIYHGTDTAQLTPGPGGNYLAWIGRLTEKKGPIEAIKIAQETGLPLKLAGPLRPAPEPDVPFYEEHIEPHLSDTIEFVGELDEKGKADFLGNAKALLNPISWPEPFGLVAIEAMACGTPVLATRLGAMPEIIEHGSTGFLADSPEDLANCVRDIDTLDRAAIRRVAEDRFSLTHMIDQYESLFEKTIKSHG